jgi:hypothetical protein
MGALWQARNKGSSSFLKKKPKNFWFLAGASLATSGVRRKGSQ